METSTGTGSSEPGDPLEQLRYHWGMESGGPYDIRIEGGAWNARWWSEPQPSLRAQTSGELRLMIRADHFRRTAPRHLVAVP